MRHALAALGIPLLFAACGGRVVLGDSPDEGLRNFGDDAAGADASSPQDGASPDDGSPDGGSFEASGGACSLVGGTWDVTYNAFYGTDASFQFSNDGTFIGGAASAALPAGEIYSGQWELAGTNPDGGAPLPTNSELTVLNTTGLGCQSAYQTTLSLAFSSDCNTVTLVDVLDACTGARKYFEGTTTLARH